MALTQSDVEHIAHLARLDLTPSEVEQYRRQLSNILDYFETLQQVDTSAVPPTATALPMSTVLREDHVVPSLPTVDALANAPDRQDSYFRVPAVFGEE